MKLPQLNTKLTLNLAIVLGILILIFMLLKGCKDDNKVYNEYKAKIDSAASLIRETNQLIAEKDARIEELQEQDSINLANLDESLVLLNETTDDLSASRKKVNALIAKINRVQPGDVVVNRDEECDSLVALVVNQDKYIQDYENQVNKTFDDFDSVIEGKDSIIKVREEEVFKLKSTVEYIQDNILKLPPELKRRNQVFLGAELLGNKTQLLDGYGANISLLNKKGQMFEAKILSVHNAAYYGVGVKMRLSVKK